MSMHIHSRENPWGDGNFISFHWRSCKKFTAWRPEARICGLKKGRYTSVGFCPSYSSPAFHDISVITSRVAKTRRSSGTQLLTSICEIHIQTFFFRWFLPEAPNKLWAIQFWAERVVYLRPPIPAWFSVLPFPGSARSQVFPIEIHGLVKLCPQRNDKFSYIQHFERDEASRTITMKGGIP